MTSASSLAFLAFNSGLLRLLGSDSRSYHGIISCVPRIGLVIQLPFLPINDSTYLLDAQ